MQNYRLNDVEVYTTLEPCPMCAFALVMARVKKVVFGAKDEKFGSFGTVFDFANNEKFNHKIDIVSGVMQKECSELLKIFFLNKRKKNLVDGEI
jgi:tRNA(adenine34) deaminase